MLTSFVTTSVQSSSSLSCTATGASISYYARLWYTLPYAVLTVPITTAMFTELSDSWARHSLSEFRQDISSGLSQILFFMGLLGKVRNAGAIFVGAWSSEPLGDYVAGPNHTLPTGGTARFSSPLGVYDFQKRSSVICYTPEGMAADAPAVQDMPTPARTSSVSPLPPRT